jgi:hypothetical protein
MDSKTAAKKKTKQTPWRHSEAKMLLYKDIIDGEVTDDIEAELVYGMREEYQAYEFKNFKTNLKNLRCTINTHQSKADEDMNALFHDMHLLPKKENTSVWHGSEAEKLLKQDIDEERNKGISTRDFWLTREEYKEFPSKKFIKHVHQGLNSRKQSKYWQHKMTKKKKFMKQIKKLVKADNDADENNEDDDAFSF